MSYSGFEMLPLGSAFELDEMTEDERGRRRRWSSGRPRAHIGWPSGQSPGVRGPARRPSTRVAPDPPVAASGISQGPPGGLGDPSLAIDGVPDCPCSNTQTATGFVGDDPPPGVTDLDDGGAPSEGNFFEFGGPVAAPAPVLAAGARGVAVQELQRRLRAAGFPPGPVDGVYGRRTQAALRSFQRVRGLAVTGALDAATSSALQQATSAAGAPSGPASGWTPPEATARAGDAQHVRYDRGTAWAGESGCSGRLSPGARTLARYLQSAFVGISKVGGYNCRRNSATPSLTSIHGVGRALDIMIPPFAQRANAAVGDPIANWLVQNAAAIGVQYLIWNRTSWNAGRPPGRKFRPYGGPNPHIDHIHAEITVAASGKTTPWFQGR